MTEKGPALARLAGSIRNHYAAYRTMWEQQHRNGKQPYDPSYWDRGLTLDDEDCIWNKLAYLVFSNRLDPSGFVQSLFESSAQFHRPPVPNTMLSQKSVETYRQFRKVTEPRIRNALTFQTAHFKSEVLRHQRYMNCELVDAMEYILLDRGTQLTPLFRYCAAIDARLTSVAERFETEAAMQYELSRELYDRVWGDFIPAPFRKVSDQLYANLVTAT